MIIPGGQENQALARSLLWGLLFLIFKWRGWLEIFHFFVVVVHSLKPPAWEMGAKRRLAEQRSGSVSGKRRLAVGCVGEETISLPGTDQGRALGLSSPRAGCDLCRGRGSAFPCLKEDQRPAEKRDQTQSGNWQEAPPRSAAGFEPGAVGTQALTSPAGVKGGNSRGD